MRENNIREGSAMGVVIYCVRMMILLNGICVLEFDCYDLFGV